MQGGAAQIAGGGELDAIRWKTISDQSEAHALSGLVIVKHREDHSAHARPSCRLDYRERLVDDVVILRLPQIPASLPPALDEAGEPAN
jgi:hypothetical protein